MTTLAEQIAANLHPPVVNPVCESGGCPTDAVCKFCIPGLLDGGGDVMNRTNTLTIIEPGSGSRFVAWLNDMARIAEGFARIARNPEVQATGSAFFDTLTSSANNELGPVKASLVLAGPPDDPEDSDHADD